MLTAQGVSVACTLRSAHALRRRGDPVGSLTMIMNMFVLLMGAVDPDVRWALSLTTLVPLESGLR